MITGHATHKLFSAILVLAILFLPFNLTTASRLASQPPIGARQPFFYSWLSQDSVPGPAQPQALPMAEGFTPQVAAAAPPLPSDCSELATPGEDPPTACVYGYVYLDGAPVLGAVVTLSSESGSLTTVTQSGPSSPEPYFAASLSDPSLAAKPGELERASTSIAGKSNGTAFTVQGGSQQVDIWFSTTCGPEYVGGVVAADTTWYRDCSPYIVTENVLVYSGYSLVIEPGVTVKFQAGKSLRVDGELKAEGLPEAMVRMTSYGATSPGEWGYVLFATGCSNALYDINGEYVSGSIMLDTLIEYAGGAADSDNAALRLDGCSPFFPRTFIRYSGGDGVRIYNNGMLVMNGGSVRESSGWGVYNRSAANQMLVAYSSLVGNGAGGIYSTGNTQMWVSDNWIADNAGNFGVYIANGSGVVGNNLISGNKGGVRLARASDLHYNIIYANRGNPAVRTNSYTMNINHNLFIQNENLSGNGGGLYISSGASNVNFNIFAGNQAAKGGGAYIASGSNFRYNAVLSNLSSDQGAGLYATNNSAVIDFNTILSNQAGEGLGAVYLDNHPSFTDNNLYGNRDYDLFNGNLASDGDLIAELNWWGTVDTLEILNHTWDFLDNSTLSLVDFDPSLASDQLSAPISPPTGLQIQRDGSSLELSWNENPEVDSAGYKIYYDQDAAGFPYAGKGLAQGDSPIDVGDVLSYTLSSLPDGIYHFALTAYDNDRDDVDDQTEGNESWFSGDVEAVIGQPPQAGFTGAPTSGMRPLTVNFTNQSTGNFDTCTWLFGDGGSSAACSDPTHTYSQAGSYDVTLTVSGPAGSGTEVKAGYITANPVPVEADFSAAPTNGTRPLEVHFTNLSSGDYSTCAWDFGDGSGSSSCGDPVHIYNTAGSYSVSLAVSGPGGDNSTNKPAYITVNPMPVQADFGAAPTSGVRPLEVHFANLSSGDYTTCTWDFGDGSSSSICGDPVYTYNTPGSYTVSLSVSGPGGDDSTNKPAYITVNSMPVQADFSAAPTSGAPPLEVQFTNQSSGDYTICAWDFGDGSSSSICNDPVHTYTAAGSYTVSLAVSGPGGDDSMNKPAHIIVASSQVKADFSAAPTSGAPPLEVHFTNLSSGDYTTCAWDFGDGGTSPACDNQVHTYTLPGLYTASLQVSGPGGTDSMMKIGLIEVQTWFEIYVPLAQK